MFLNVLEKIRRQTQRIETRVLYPYRKKKFKPEIIPVENSIDQKILEGIRRVGFFQTSLAELNLKSNSILLNNWNGLVNKMEQIPASKDPVKPYMGHLSNEEVMDRDLLLWGLDERLITLAENYFSLPVCYRGVFARRDFVDGLETETRVWHIDPEDFRILKVIIYLKDVGLDDGPFEAIPRNYTPLLSLLPQDKKNRIQNELVNQKIPKEKVNTMLGGQGTVLFADTCSIYHRGRLPLRMNRSALFYTFLSKFPYRPEMCSSTFSVADFRKKYGGQLSPRQLSTVQS